MSRRSRRLTKFHDVDYFPLSSSLTLAEDWKRIMAEPQNFAEDGQPARNAVVQVIGRQSHQNLGAKMQDLQVKPASNTNPASTAKTFSRITVLVFVLAVPASIPVFWFVLSWTAEARQAGSGFVNCLQENEYRSAFEMCHQDLQRQLGTAEALARLTKPEVLPRSWFWTSSEVDADRARLRYSWDSWWGSGGLSVHLRQEVGKWKVEYLSANKYGERFELGSAPGR